MILAELSSRFWDVAMSNSPLWASLLGDHRFDADVEDLSREHEDEVIEQLDGIIAMAQAIAPASLDRDDRITRHVLISEAEGIAGNLRSRTAEFMIDPMLSVHIDMIQAVPQLRAATDDQAWAFVEKASKVGKQFDQALERHRQGVANGRTPPRVGVEKVLAQLDAFAELSVSENPFMQIGLPDGWDDLKRARWRHGMEEQVTEVNQPCFARYRDGIAADVLSSRDRGESACWLPDGEDLPPGGQAIHALDADPRIHQIGLDEIASRDEYRTLGSKVPDNEHSEDLRAASQRSRTRFKTARRHRAAERRSCH